MELFKKYSDEVVVLGFDFSSEMDTGEVINSSNSSISVYDINDNDVTTTLMESGSLVVNDSTILQGTFKDGTVGEFYTIVFFAYVATSKQLVGQAIVEIVD